jgi:hypothetical protein
LGAFSSICVGLFGAYAFTAAYALILWARDRRARLPLLVAAHAVSAAALALSLLWISRASTVGAMQMAVTVRVWTIVATGLSVTAMLALASRQPMAPWLGGLGAYMAALLAWRHYSAPFAADVVGVQRVVSLGEWVWAPVRAPGLAPVEERQVCRCAPRHHGARGAAARTTALADPGRADDEPADSPRAPARDRAARGRPAGP